VPTNTAHSSPQRGYTTREIAARYRVSEDRVRRWIARGELRAINRRDSRAGRPSWVIPPEALAEFERGRQAASADAPKRFHRPTCPTRKGVAP
jgi:excisionase family DNA binding protein